jgi:integrase/recombinase XerD
MGQQSPNGDLGFLLEAERWEHQVYKTKHDCLNQWLLRKDSTNRCSRRTLNEYSRSVSKLFHHFYPEKHPTELTVGDVEEWVMDMNDRGLSDSSKRRYVENLSSFYQWAVKRPRFEDISGNPAGIVLEELPRTTRERPDTATWENGRKIIQHIPDPRDKAITVLLAKTGCRVTEACSIKKHHLDLENGFIRLEDRKGSTTTTNPVDDETIRTLRRVQAFTEQDSDWLFPSNKTGFINRERIRREVKKAAYRANITDTVDETRWHHKFVPHYYRTIWTSLMRNHRDAMPDHFVRYLRGDSNQETMDLYTKQPRQQVREEYLEAIKTLGL